jgi:MscS family membrane protein
MKTIQLKLTLLLLVLLGFSLIANAQEKAPATVPVVVPVAVDTGPEDALNRGTPRGSIVGFLEACSAFDFEKAAQFLDLRNLPREAENLGGRELARQMNHVLSRAVWLDDYTVSDSPDGIKGDGLPSYRDELVMVKALEGDVPLWMQKVPRGDGEDIWKVSNRSVALIPRLYDEFSYPEWIEKLRNGLPENASFLGLEAFKWLILLGVLLVSWPVLYLIALLFLRIFSSPSKSTYPVLRKALTGPMVMAGMLLIGGFTIERLGAGAQAQVIMDANTLKTIVVIWLFWSLINLFKLHQQKKLYASGRPGAAKLMQPMTLLIKLTILVFGALFWLANIGFNITTVLGALGVGGLALALALQKPIEDMMGALTLFTQAPIRVGDLCKYGPVMGEIEDIGLRSTRIRTLTNTLVHVPNARIAHIEVENFSARTKIRFWPTLRLRYDATPQQLRTVMAGILEMLEQNERVYDDPLRVRFTEFDDDAILIKIHSFLKTTNFAESLEIGEELNLRIMEIVLAAGVEFALPGRSIYVEGETAESTIPLPAP